jgi:N-acetylmuramoyl-L-alanine amidase
MRLLRQTGKALLVAVVTFLACADRAPARSGSEHSPVNAAATTCRRDAFRVVVDVGHTLAVPGALSARGRVEYKFNLDLAQDIYQTLVDAGFTNSVLLLTNEPPPAGLLVRAHHANQMRADLFIAIHHDSVPDNLLQPWEFDGQQRRFNDQYPGYAIFMSNDNADRAGSLLFGKLLGRELQARGLQYTPHYTLALMGHRRRELVDAAAGVYRYDQLVVLRETHMPAVLLEAGSIVNRQEETELASPARRTLTSAAVAAATEEFCAARTRPRVEPAVKHPSTGANSR